MPQTTYEHLICIALFITSAIIFAYVMGHVSVLSEQLHVSDALCAGLLPSQSVAPTQATRSAGGTPLTDCLNTAATDRPGLSMNPSEPPLNPAEPRCNPSEPL